MMHSLSIDLILSSFYMDAEAGESVGCEVI